jgi:arylsulfatase A-like enzyme
LAALAVLSTTSPVQAADKEPNILVFMGDDVGWFNIGAYHRGMMSGKIP